MRFLKFVNEDFCWFGINDISLLVIVISFVFVFIVVILWFGAIPVNDCWYLPDNWKVIFVSRAFLIALALVIRSYVTVQVIVKIDQVGYIVEVLWWTSVTLGHHLKLGFSAPKALFILLSRWSLSNQTFTINRLMLEFLRFFRDFIQLSTFEQFRFRVKRWLFSQTCEIEHFKLIGRRWQRIFQIFIALQFFH